MAQAAIKQDNDGKYFYSFGVKDWICFLCAGVWMQRSKVTILQVCTGFYSLPGEPE